MPSRTISTVSFDGRYSLGRVLRAEIRAETESHTVVILSFSATRKAKMSIPPEGTPLVYQWGAFPKTNTFYGYVNHHEMLQQNAGEIRVFCIGTSQPMNASNPKSWTNISASYIAREIADRYGLRAVLSRPTGVLSYWAQGTESDFAMMNRLAERVGFKFWVDGSTLYFIDPSVLVTRANPGQVKTYTGNENGIGSLLQIHSISGSLAPGNATVTDVFGLDGSGVLVKSSSARDYSDRGMKTPSLKTVSGQAVGSAAEARSVTSASANLGNWATLRAIVTDAAETRLGDVVSLDGTSLNPDYRGRWMVAGFIHVVPTSLNNSVDAVESRLDLIRNQPNAQVFARSTMLKSTPPVVPAVIRSGRWEASVKGAFYV